MNKDCRLPNCVNCLVYVKLNRKNINSSAAKLNLYLLINCMVVCFIHFHHVHSFVLEYVHHFLNHTFAFLGPLWPSPLVRITVAPALYIANSYGCSLLLLFCLSNIPIQNRFVLATGLAEQLTIRCFANPL